MEGVFYAVFCHLPNFVSFLKGNMIVYEKILCSILSKLRIYNATT